MSSSSPTTGATTRSSSSSSKTSSPPQDSGRPFLFPSTPGSSGSGFVPMEFQDVSSPSKNAKGTSKPPSRVLHKPPAAAAAAPEPDPPGNKRRSSRAIKRKKFDDEIIDSPSLLPPPSPLNVASSGPGPLNILPAAASAASSPGSPALSSPSTPVGHGTLSGGTPTGKLGPPPPGGPSSSGSPSGIPPLLGQGANGKGMGKIIRSRTTSASKSELDMSLANSRAALRKKTSSAANKKTKRTKREGAWKDLSRWKPTDDLALITAVQQTSDLATVYRGVKFSCHFTLTEVQERWNALMYEPIISKLALQAIKNLLPEIVLSVQRKTLFSKAEQDTLSTIKASQSPSPTLKDFEDLLKSHPQVFHSARTPRCLAQYWQSLRQYTLLPDQSVHPLPKDNNILNFLDAEANINDGELFEEKDELLDHELTATDRRVKKEIRHLEAEVGKWQILVDKVRGDNPPDFDNQTLAVLRGRLVRYLMRSKEITLGRTTKDQAVDVDLKLEGPAWKISRRQGVIKLRNSGEFFIANEGRRCMFVEGKPVHRGTKARLCNNSVLEIAGLKFVFLINQDLIEAIRHEASKLYQNS